MTITVWKFPSFIDKIPEGWFLYAALEVRTPIIHSGDTHEPTGKFGVMLQWINGGGRLTEGEGNTLENALDNAIENVKRKWS